MNGMTTTTVLDVREALVIRPGDTLVLRVSPYTSISQCHAAREALLERLGDRVADVLIVATEQLAVIRGELAA